MLPKMNSDVDVFGSKSSQITICCQQQIQAANMLFPNGIISNSSFSPTVPPSSNSFKSQNTFYLSLPSFSSFFETITNQNNFQTAFQGIFRDLSAPIQMPLFQQDTTLVRQRSFQPYKKQGCQVQSNQQAKWDYSFNQFRQIYKEQGDGSAKKINARVGQEEVLKRGSKCETNNYLATLRSIYWKCFSDKMGKMVIRNHPALCRFKSKSWMTKKDFAELHGMPEFEPILDELLLVPGVLENYLEKSKCHDQTKAIFRAKYDIIRRAYANKTFVEPIHKKMQKH